jgi:hypothetical protein
MPVTHGKTNHGDIIFNPPEGRVKPIPDDIGFVAPLPAGRQGGWGVIGQVKMMLNRVPVELIL